MSVFPVHYNINLMKMGVKILGVAFFEKKREIFSDPPFVWSVTTCIPFTAYCLVFRN